MKFTDLALLTLLCLCVLTVGAAPARRLRHGLVAPNQPTTQRTVESSSVVSDESLIQVHLEAFPTTTFIGSAFPIGLAVPTAIPKGSQLTIRATGNGKDTVTVTLPEGSTSASFVITPTGDVNGVYSIYFEIDARSPNSAKGYKAPSPFTIPIQESSQILLFRSSQDTGLDVRGGSFDYIFVNQSLVVDVYLGVPVPATSKGNLSLIVQCDDGFQSSLEFPPGSVFRSFSFSTFAKPSNYTMSFSLSGHSAEFYVAPPAFQFVLMDSIQISLLGTETELYINDTIPIEGILSAPLPFGEQVNLALVASNNQVEYMSWASRSFESDCLFEAGQVPGIYRMFFHASDEFFFANTIYTPLPFNFVVFNRTRLYQITVESSPSSLFMGTFFPFTVNLHSPVPTGKELNVIATGSDGKTYTLVFYAGESNKTFECYPAKEGPFTIVFSVEGSAAEKYSPPPLIGFEVFPPGEGVTLLDAETELMIGETITIEVSLGVPVPIGSNLTVTYVATNGQTASVHFTGLEVVKPLDFYAGDVSGTYIAEWHLEGTAKHYYTPPPVFGFAVISQNYMGNFGKR